MPKQPAIQLLLFAVLASILFAFMFGIHNIIYLAGSLGDQLNYANVARNLATTGHFIQHGQFEGTGNIILPGILTSEHTRLYVPGFYLILAGFFKLFGYSPINAVLPNIIIHILATGLTFHIAKKLYDEKTAFFSAIIFFIFPFNVFTAFSCMGDIVLPFAALTSFAIFLALPTRTRVWSIPLLVGFVYLFRQTGLFMIIPLLGYYYDNTPNSRWWHLLLALFATIFFCHLLNDWQTHVGLSRVHFLDVLSTGHINYANAYPEVSTLKVLPTIDIIKLIFNHTISNIITFFKSFNGIKPTINFLAETSFAMMFVMLIFASIGSLKNIYRETFALSCCLFLIVISAADIIYYMGILRTFMRMTMISFPFVIIQAVRFRPTHSKIGFGFICLLSAVTIQIGSHRLRHNQKYVHQFDNFMHKVNPSPTGLIACPTMFFRPYAFDHYPQLMSFVPANRQTLQLLNNKYPISTIVIPAKDLGSTITQRDINEIGLHLTQKIAFWQSDYLVFK